MESATDENFEEKVAKGVTLVDFFAAWCGPCKMIAPIFEELAGEMAGKANFVKVDVDACQSTAMKHNVTSIPTLILFKDGKSEKTLVGMQDKESLKAFVESAL